MKNLPTAQGYHYTPISIDLSRIMAREDSLRTMYDTSVPLRKDRSKRDNQQIKSLRRKKMGKPSYRQRQSHA